MLRNKKAILLLLVLCICRTVMMAQDLNPSDNGNTPYSRYGYGSLADNSFVANKGMGGVGIGLRNRSQINVQNPASYTAIDSLTSLFDFGMNGQMSVFREPGVSQTDWSAGIDYVAFQVPLGKKFAATAGLLPFSYVGYEYGNQSDLIAGEDSIAATRKYTGNHCWPRLLCKVFFWPMTGSVLSLIHHFIENAFTFKGTAAEPNNDFSKWSKLRL